MEWIQILDNNCWKECDQKGGLCTACLNYEPDAISGYCCSGSNHFRGEGPKNNGDCPTQAVEAQKSTVHSCVVSKKKYPVPEPTDGKIYKCYCFLPLLCLFYRF